MELKVNVTIRPVLANALPFEYLYLSPPRYNIAKTHISKDPELELVFGLTSQPKRLFKMFNLKMPPLALTLAVNLSLDTILTHS